MLRATPHLVGNPLNHHLMNHDTCTDTLSPFWVNFREGNWPVPLENLLQPKKTKMWFRPSRLFSCSTVCVRMVDGCKWYGASAYFKKLKVNWRISLVILKWVDENSCQFFMFEVLISDFSFRYLLYAYLSCHRHWGYYGAYIRHPLNGFINVFGAWFSNEMEDT